MRQVALAVLLTGCGRIAFDPRIDATVVSDLAGEAACTGPFGPLRAVTEVNSASEEEGAFLTADGLELYFGSKRPGGAGDFDIYVAVRSDRASPFGAPTQLAVFATAGEDNNPYLSPDGLEMWFDSGGQILHTTRADRASPWGAAQLVTELSGGTYTGCVALTNDQLTIYFSSLRPGVMGSQDLFRASRTSTTSAFGAAVLQGTASSGSYDACPNPLPDGNALFTTDRSGLNDIYIATADGDGDLGVATPYAQLNSSGEDWDAFATADDRYEGVSSDRPGGLGLHDIWLMERSCP